MMQTPLDFFVRLQCLFTVAALLGGAVRLVGRNSWFRMGDELLIHYFLLALFAVLLLAPLPGGESFTYHPVAHVEASLLASGVVAEKPILVLSSMKTASLPLDWGVWAALFATLFGAAATALDYFRLRSLLRRTTVFRCIGRVRLAVCEGTCSPFSVRGLRYAYVVLPASFLADPLRRRIAIAHEIQHHRAGDTLWCHAFAPLRALCFFHPLRPLWFAAVSEAQELACDDVLVSQKKKISVGDYARCLVNAAESAAHGKRGRAYAAAPFSVRGVY